MNEEQKGDWIWTHPVSEEGGSPWFLDKSESPFTGGVVKTPPIGHKLTAIIGPDLISWKLGPTWQERQANTLRALADLPEPLTPEQLRLAADMLDTWTGTLPELLTSISEITAPRQVAE